MIPIARPLLGEEEEAAVLAVMRSGMLAQGPQVASFEEAFAAATGARHAVATSSGTTALYLALLAHRIGPGDEVVISPLTFIATANAVAHTGARPVFADVDATLNLSPAAAEAAITPRTRAIVPVHLHGEPADLDAFCDIGRRHGVAIIQDACQAVGATLGERRLGVFGTAVYSLYATKNITTGEGGMVTTNDPEVAATVASLRHQAYASRPYEHSEIAYNFRMTEIQAAIGRVQLRRLEVLNEQRRANARFYDSTIHRFQTPARTPGATHVFHQYCLLTDAGTDRDGVVARLHELGVGAAIHYPVPVHRQPAYRDHAGACCPVAEASAGRIFSIPVHPALSAGDLDLVAAAVNGL